MLLRWKPRQYAQNGGNQDIMLKMVETRTIQSELNIEILPPLVVVFLQFKICLRFPRHMYNDMVLLSTAVLAHSLNVILRKWQFIKICQILMTS